MSYCRHGHNSDFYVYSDGEKFRCYGPKGQDNVFQTRMEVLQFLMLAEKKGYLVPEYAFNRLAREMLEEPSAIEIEEEA